MSESVAVIIGTFGDYGQWGSYARRALESVERQTRLPDEVVLYHGASLAQARNNAAKEASSDWLIFLDADDELDERYVEKSLAASGDIRQPATLGFGEDGWDDSPVLLPEVSLFERNYIVVGAMQRRAKFAAAGGFGDYPALEDWELWLRLVLEQDASIYPCPEAIYKVYVAPQGRNQSMERHGESYVSIRQRHQAAWERKYG